MSKNVSNAQEAMAATFGCSKKDLRFAQDDYGRYVISPNGEWHDRQYFD